ncbi:MAG: CDP-diacylglycerol--glycerol-3-phosphate 3-phosphatidyltransferase [Candidatus Anoxychlamydiales bacterium]|nr:CDP-diacylglycerol--glycerol-3-phosphate 3-phosphatidyltransferase [Candidatus Anoxychlamydiales bacterium]
MITLSNGLSIIRIPLALLFLWQNIYVRIIAIVLAMFTDSIDGYFARKYKSASKFGAFLDPAMDKCFVFFVLSILIMEKHILLWQALAMISRDFALIIFTTYLFITKKLANYEVRAVRWGKVTTAMQFCVLIGLTLSFAFSWYIYAVFVLLGVLAFIELLVGSFSKRPT